MRHRAEHHTRCRFGSLAETCAEVQPADSGAEHARSLVAFPTLEHSQCKSCRAPSSSGRKVSDRTNQEHENLFQMMCVLGILTVMCPEHIKTHIRLNLTRLPDFASVRSEIETFLEARQSSANPDAMDVGSLSGKRGVCRTCGQRGHWAAECPKGRGRFIVMWWQKR